jgi:hypothetical protein
MLCGPVGKAGRRIQCPYARSPGERFSPIRFSLTGADSNLGVLAEKPVRRAANRKTLFIIACSRQFMYRFQGAWDCWFLLGIIQRIPLFPLTPAKGSVPSLRMARYPA